MNLNTHLGRYVAFGASALAALVAAFVANEAQILFHLHLNKELLLGYLTPFTVGTFAMAYKWLHNLGAQELSKLEKTLNVSPAVLAELEKLVIAHLPPAPKAPKAK